MNDFKTRQGENEDSANVFAHSWRINMDQCETPPPEDPCDMNPERKAWAVNKCNYINDPIFASCHRVVSY